MKLSTKVRSEWIERCAKGMDGGRASGSTEPQREPVKFEAGQVVRVVMHDRGRVTGDTAKVAVKTTLSTFWCADMRNLLYLHHYFVDSDCHNYALVSPAPRAGDTWSNGESVARIELCTRGGASLRIVSEGEPFVGDVVAVARRLWEGGYRIAQRAMSYDDVIAAQRAPVPRAGDVYEHADGTIVELREGNGRMYTHALRSLVDLPLLVQADEPAVLADLLRQWGYTKRDGAWHIHEPNNQIASWCADSAKKWMDRGALKQQPQHVDCRIRCTDLLDSTRTGRTPDVRPLASLANVVAAIFTRPDLATSRRFIDQAIASLRGEPFAAAIGAALVAAGDVPLSPHQIAAIVRGARANEQRRGEVAPARRTLTEEQFSECCVAAIAASCGEWYVRLSHVYERARTA